VAFIGCHDPLILHYDRIETVRHLQGGCGTRIILVSSGVTRVSTDYPIEGVFVSSFTVKQLADVLTAGLAAAKTFHRYALRGNDCRQR
jgi:hypothetical protein